MTLTERKIKQNLQNGYGYIYVVEINKKYFACVVYPTESGYCLSHPYGGAQYSAERQDVSVVLQFMTLIGNIKKWTRASERDIRQVVHKSVLTVLPYKST